jgi:hypothetical protein
MRRIMLPAGPLKRIWVNKHVLPQFGGRSLTSPVWFVESEMQGEPVRYEGYRVEIGGNEDVTCVYAPGEPEHGPHAWVETQAEVVVYQAVSTGEEGKDGR